MASNDKQPRKKAKWQPPPGDARRARQLVDKYLELKVQLEETRDPSEKRRLQAEINETEHRLQKYPARMLGDRIIKVKKRKKGSGGGWKRDLQGGAPQ